MNRNPDALQYAKITKTDAADWRISLLGHTSEILNPAKTVGAANYTEGDIVPVMIQDGDPNRILVQLDVRGTRAMKTVTVKSPWVSGSDPPAQDPNWHVGE